MGPLTFLLPGWGYKAGFVTALLGSFQNKPGVYSSSWVTLQICLSLSMTSEELHSRALCVLYRQLQDNLMKSVLCPPIKPSLQVGWTSDLWVFVPGVALGFSMVP